MRKPNRMTTRPTLLASSARLKKLNARPQRFSAFVFADRSIAGEREQIGLQL
jgi:hypothetical protein